MKRHKKTMLITITAFVVILIWIIFCGYEWSWGPFSRMYNLKTLQLPGNDKCYDIKNVRVNEDSALKGKTIIFLGSSVTYGAASQGVSFADYIGAETGCNVVKEAVSGTTLVDEGASSYIKRLEKIQALQADIFVCQLSTNDATQKKELGEISGSRSIEDFDTKTVAGAIEYIICYVKQRWECPVIFYSNPKYDSERYEAMVELLQKIQDKWEITVIDLWNDTEFNAISDDERKLYMADAIHPTQAGYLEWWTPVFEEYLNVHYEKQE